MKFFRACSLVGHVKVKVDTYKSESLINVSLTLNLLNVRWCSLCRDQLPVCRLLNQLKSLVIRPIQQAISSQA